MTQQYQKFLFTENYSTEAEALELKRQKQLAEAQELLKDDIDNAKKQAFEEGFQEGQKMALEKLKTEMDLHVNTLIENITKINDYKPELHNLFEQQSTACVRHLVDNLFFKAQELFPEKLLDQAIEQALSNLPMVAQITIQVPMHCKMYLQDTKIEEKIHQAGITDFKIIEDQSLNPGECRIVWDKSGVLASKKDAFEKINTTLQSFVSPQDIALSNETQTTQQVVTQDTENTSDEQSVAN